MGTMADLPNMMTQAYGSASPHYGDQHSNNDPPQPYLSPNAAAAATELI